MSLDSFVNLDDLAQVIYQGTSRFILLSSVQFDSSPQKWELHVGVMDIGRWWSTQWPVEDVKEYLGNEFSEEKLEELAEELAEAIVSRALSLDGWTTPPPNRGTRDLRAIFSLKGKNTLILPLKELTETEALNYTTSTLFSLGLNAHQRKCRINPPAYATSVETTYTHRLVPDHLSKRTRSPSFSLPESDHDDANKQISNKIQSRSSISNAVVGKKQMLKAAVRPIESETTTPAPKTRPRIVKKKARTVQAMEFASDEE